MTETRRLQSFNRPLVLKILGVLALVAALLADDLEDGVPLPLLKHGIEVLRALATAAASTAERRVARKDIDSKPPHGSWQALFDASNEAAGVVA